MGIFYNLSKIMKLVPFILIIDGTSKQHKMMPQEVFYQSILYFSWADQRDKVCFIFHKVQGCCTEKKHNYKVNLFIVFTPQCIPAGDIAFLHTSITLDSRL